MGKGNIDFKFSFALMKAGFGLTTHFVSCIHIMSEQTDK